MKRLIGAAAAVAVLAVVAVATLPLEAAAQAPRVVSALAPTAQVGLTIRDVTSEEAAQAKLPRPGGVYVESVREGSPAAQAGLQIGDIVTEFDGERVRSAAHFTRLVQESVPDRQVAATISRGSARQTLNVVPERSPLLGGLQGRNAQRALGQLRLRTPDLNFDVETFRRSTIGSGGGLGVTVSPLTGQLADYFGAKQGVLVNSVTAGSPAAAAGLRAGDVITRVNGQNITTAADVTRAVRQAGAGGQLSIAVVREKREETLSATLPGTPAPPASGRGGLPV